MKAFLSGLIGGLFTFGIVLVTLSLVGSKDDGVKQTVFLFSGAAIVIIAAFACNFLPEEKPPLSPAEQRANDLEIAKAAYEKGESNTELLTLYKDDPKFCSEYNEYVKKRYQEKTDQLYKNLHTLQFTQACKGIGILKDWKANSLVNSLSQTLGDVKGLMSGNMKVIVHRSLETIPGFVDWLGQVRPISIQDDREGHQR